MLNKNSIQDFTKANEGLRIFWDRQANLVSFLTPSIFYLRSSISCFGDMSLLTSSKSDFVV